MSKAREFIRGFARRDNRFGFACSVFLCLVRKGPAAAGNMIEDRSLRNQRLKDRVRAADLIRFSGEDLQRQRDASSGLDVLISIVTPLYNTPVDFLREMIDSVLAQTYPRWELCLADGSDDAHTKVGEICREYAARDSRIRYRKLERNGGISENTNACIAMAAGDYIALFDHDDLLLPDALYENASAIRETGADFLYSDEYVFISPDTRTILNTHFKPDFSPDALLTNNYICHLSVFRKALLERTGGFRKEYDGSQDHDLILRLTDAASKVVHIPKPLYLWRSHAASVASDISAKTYAIDAGRRAVRDFLGAKGIQVQVDSVDAYPTMYHVRYPIPREPSVCIILDLYDTRRTVAETEKQLDELKVRSGVGRVSFAVITAKDCPCGQDTDSVHWHTSSEENRPKRLNEVIRKTDSDYLLLLDPGLQCISENWVLEMLMLAQQEEIGAVGARILFADRHVRHAGLALGLGKQRLAGRLFYRFPEEEAGYFGQIAVVQDLSAVSGECLMIRRDKYDRAGGFSETYRNGLFDVDFCLKLRQLRYRNVYCPFSEFTGGKKRRYSMDYSREKKEYEKDAEVFHHAWAEVLRVPDPYYNPNLSREYADFRVKEVPPTRGAL